MNFEAAASETFQILRSYDYEVVLFNDEHNQVFEPSEARRFFAKPVNLLVSLVDDGESSAVRLYLSKSIRVSQVIGLVSGLRAMATKYKMVFNVREYNKVLSPKDFATQASVTESKGSTGMNLVEGMYGTSRSSYLKLENARMIVRHSTRINENILGARGRNVETIHIEDNQGQRFLMPTQQLAPARAMAHHVDNGGSWADSVGEQISRMAQNFADLGAASRHIGHYSPELSESALAVRDVVREAARGLRKTFEGFGRKTRYADICEQVSKLGETLNEDASYNEKVNELASLLNTDSVQLSEHVLTTVARVLESAEPVIEDTQPTVSVLGHPVNMAAWEAFKAGKLDLSEPVQAPNGMHAMAILQAIIAATNDDSLANLFTYVFEEMKLPVEKRAASMKVQQVLFQAIKCVRAGQRREDDDVTRNPAVREFMEWAGKHSIRAINETDRLAEPQHDDAGSGVLAKAVADFDYNDFMAYAHEFMHDQLDQLSPEEKSFTQDEVLAAIDGYLQDKVIDVGHGMDTLAQAKRLAPQVIEYMEADGYAVESAVDEDACMADRDIMGLSADTMEEEAVDENCGDCDGDDLTKEDVILPTKQTDDLKSEVTKKKVDGEHGEQEPDDQYINRLQSLAGVRGRGF